MEEQAGISGMGQGDPLLDVVLLFARLALASAFLYSGINKVLRWPAALVEVDQLGLPQPKLALIVTISVQLMGSAMLITGRGLTVGTLLLAAFTIAATLLGHPFWRFGGAKFEHELTTALEHLGLVAGLALLAMIGPGNLAI